MQQENYGRMSKKGKIMDCTLEFYNGKIAKAEGKPLGVSGWLIRLRSWPFIHVEVIFSSRYGGISWSCTLRDGCKCCRFKLIDYTKHPERWEGVVVPFTDEEEDRAWEMACSMADLPDDWQDSELGDYPLWYLQDNGCYYGDDPIKYDILGMGCHISVTRKWWKSNPDKTNCSKACNDLVLEAIIERPNVKDYAELFLRQDEMKPTELYNLVKGLQCG